MAAMSPARLFPEAAPASTIGAVNLLEQPAETTLQKAGYREKATVSKEPDTLDKLLANPGAFQ